MCPIMNDSSQYDIDIDVAGRDEDFSQEAFADRRCPCCCGRGGISAEGAPSSLGYRCPDCEGTGRLLVDEDSP